MWRWISRRYCNRRSCRACSIRTPSRSSNLATGEREPHALSPHVAYGDRARVRWLVTNPAETKFEIRFQTAAQRPVLRPRADTPLIGVGDLLRYTGAAAAAHREQSGDAAGRSQWRRRARSRRHRLLHDRTAVAGADSGFVESVPLLSGRAGSAIRCCLAMRCGCAIASKPDGPDQFFIGGYMHCDVADVNGDGLPDLAFAAAEKSSEASKVPDVAEFIHIYLNSGKRDAGGMPIFVYSDRVKHPKGNWGPVRIVDLDRDGAVDFVVGSLFSETNPKAYFIRNTNPAGWPIKAAEAGRLLARRDGWIPGCGWRRHPRQRVRDA